MIRCSNYKSLSGTISPSLTNPICPNNTYMPYTHNWEINGLYRKFTGEINGDDILESNFELHTDPGFQHIKYVINDFAEITDHSIEVSHTKVYALTDQMISDTKGSLRIALVVTQEPHIELANSYRSQMEGKRFLCEIFGTVGDARKWVNEEF